MSPSRHSNFLNVYTYLKYSLFFLPAPGIGGAPLWPGGAGGSHLSILPKSSIESSFSSGSSILSSSSIGESSSCSESSRLSSSPIDLSSSELSESSSSSSAIVESSKKYLNWSTESRSRKKDYNVIYSVGIWYYLLQFFLKIH